MHAIHTVLPVFLVGGGFLGILIAGAYLVFRRSPVDPKPNSHQEERKE